MPQSAQLAGCEKVKEVIYILYIEEKLLVYSVLPLMRLIMHISNKDNARIEPNVSTINQSNKMSKFAQNLRYIFPRIRLFLDYL